MIIPIIILFIVFILIAIRQVGNVKLDIWQIMLGGAILVLLLGQISFNDAFNAINLDVIIFLFGMFVIGAALEESGYLAYISYNIFKNAKSLDTILLFIIFGFGFLSAFLMNDTIAIIGTAVVIMLAKSHKINSKPLLLALCFSVTIGSVMSPIGNPQNLLIAINGNISNPFLLFLKYLFIPTLINLLLIYVLIKFFYKEHFHSMPLKHSKEKIKDEKLALISKISMFLVISLVLIKILIVMLHLNFDFRLTYIAVIGSLPILLFSNKRVQILKKTDYHTLIFFASMFILMASVWNTGFFQSTIPKFHLDITSIPVIFGVSILMSQLISNVPLVALYMPLLMNAGVTNKELVALAAGSTIAGNLLILGAASTIIIIQNAEKRGEEGITFWEFAKIGIPLTILNVIVYLFFLSF